ncbi:hypothetical protein C943_00009 [Mariniradius saccharolyticus AK6]|uniref:Uncharacterized protein n=1 Tax=Mariniradius saccharolyticus AK6 TaxID=1239962 RepID=M7YDJ8_9BACT|nr:hypothetical protein C943_00009 [Mariniradius saccharolyticus AK6]
MCSENAAEIFVMAEDFDPASMDEFPFSQQKEIFKNMS